MLNLALTHNRSWRTINSVRVCPPKKRPLKYMVFATGYTTTPTFNQCRVGTELLNQRLTTGNHSMSLDISVKPRQTKCVACSNYLLVTKYMPATT